MKTENRKQKTENKALLFIVGMFLGSLLTIVARVLILKEGGC